MNNKNNKVINKVNSRRDVDMGEMLTYRRAHDSIGELAFIERYVSPRVTDAVVAEDGTIHAFHVAIPNADGSPSRYAFIAHTDSVHNRHNPEPRQKVAYDATLQQFIVADPKQRDCLGADDAAGCYVLCRMIDAGVPGLYVFFRNEERGGIGSGYVAEYRQDLFDGIDAAIQFDRRGTRSIITQMACGRTCSDAFAKSLSGALDMGHELDPTGSFTDTANLIYLVPECTNISVGYDAEHSSSETQAAWYIEELAERCITVFAADPGLVIEGVTEAQRWDSAPRYGEAMPYDVDLCDMTDADLAWIVDNNTPEVVVGLLKAARDELADLRYGDVDMDDIDFAPWGRDRRG